MKYQHLATRFARIVLALANEMKRRNVGLGLASLCIGGGQGMAIAIEAV